MPHASRYDLFQQALVKARLERGFTQTETARRLGKPQSFVSKYESGERRLDVIEFLDVCKALSKPPREILTKLTFGIHTKPSILTRWDVSEEDFTELVDHNPSLRGILLGYVAEEKFHDLFLGHPEISEKAKDDDHDRKKKGDRRIVYKGKAFTIEVKSLQTKTVKQSGPDEWRGKAQVDASDRRIVKFPDGTELNTTLLLRGEFDLLAVNCFAFGDSWRFVFAKNSDLPYSNFKNYTKAQAEQLIASLVSIEWPPQPPFTDNLFPLLEELLQETKDLKIIETTQSVLAEERVLKIKKNS